MIILAYFHCLKYFYVEREGGLKSPKCAYVIYEWSISAANLEELEYIQNGLDFYRSDFAWASDEIYDLVDAFHRKERLKDDTPEEVSIKIIFKKNICLIPI